MKLIITLIHEDKIINIMNDNTLHILEIKKIKNSGNNPCQEFSLRRKQIVGLCWPVLVNNVLLEYTYNYLFMCCSWS